MGRARRPVGFIRCPKARRTAVYKREPTMFKKAMELHENCGVTVTLVTENQGVFHFYNTSHKCMKQVFKEYLDVLEDSPDVFSSKIPAASTHQEHNVHSNDIVVSSSQLEDFQMDDFNNVMEVDLVDPLDILPDLETGHHTMGDCELGATDTSVLIDRSATIDVPTTISPATNNVAPAPNVNCNAVPSVATTTSSAPCEVGADVIVKANNTSVVGKDMSKEARQARKAARLESRNKANRLEAKREALKLERKIARLTSKTSSSPTIVSIAKKANPKPAISRTATVEKIAPVVVVLQPVLASSTGDVQESLAKKPKRTVNSEVGTILTIMTKATTPARLKIATSQWAQQLNHRVSVGAIGKRKMCDTDINHVKAAKVPFKHLNPFQAPVHPSIVERPRVLSPAEEDIGNWLDRVTTTLSVDLNKEVVDQSDPLFAQFAHF